MGDGGRGGAARRWLPLPDEMRCEVLTGRTQTRADGWLLPLTACQGWAREPRRRVGPDALIAVAGLSGPTGVAETDRATAAGLGARKHMRRPDVEYVPPKWQAGGRASDRSDP